MSKLPHDQQQVRATRTMWPSDFTPDDSNFCPSNFSLGTVDKGDLLAKIETKRILDLIEKRAIA